MDTLRNILSIHIVELIIEPLDDIIKLEVFIEHVPRAVMNVYRPGCMQCMQLQST